MPEAARPRDIMPAHEARETAIACVSSILDALGILHEVNRDAARRERLDRLVYEGIVAFEIRRLDAARHDAEMSYYDALRTRHREVSAGFAAYYGDQMERHGMELDLRCVRTPKDAEEFIARMRAHWAAQPSNDEVARLWDLVERRSAAGRGSHLDPLDHGKLTLLKDDHPAAKLRAGDACIVRLRGGQTMPARVEEVCDGDAPDGPALFFTVSTDYNGEPGYYYHHVDHALVRPAEPEPHAAKARREGSS